MRYFSLLLSYYITHIYMVYTRSNKMQIEVNANKTYRCLNNLLSKLLYNLKNNLPTLSFIHLMN